MGEQKLGGRIDGRRLGDLVIELADALVEPLEQFKALVAAARGVRREGETRQLAESHLTRPLFRQIVARIERSRALATERGR